MKILIKNITEKLMDYEGSIECKNLVNNGDEILFLKPIKFVGTLKKGMDFVEISGKVFAAFTTNCHLCGKETEKTVRYLHDRVLEQGFGPDDFRIYAGTGSKDIAYPNLTPQIEAMKKDTEIFRFSSKMDEGNLHYVVMEDAPHTYEKVYHHVYHYAPVLFPAC